MVPPPSLTDTSLFPGHMCYMLEYAPPDKRASRGLQSASTTTLLTSDSLSPAGSDQSSTTLADIKSGEVESDADQLSPTTTTDKASGATDPPKSMGDAANQAVESESPSSGTPRASIPPSPSSSDTLSVTQMSPTTEVQEKDDMPFYF